MLYYANLFLIFVILIDLIFYIKIKIHILIAEDGFYICLFSLPLIYINSDKTINRLKKKVSLEKIKNTQKEDLIIINSFNIDCLHINIKYEVAKEYIYIIYPLAGTLYSLNKSLMKNDFILQSKENEKYIVYLKMNLKIDNLLKQYIKIRRKKYERASNK